MSWGFCLGGDSSEIRGGNCQGEGTGFPTGEEALEVLVAK